MQIHNILLDLLPQWFSAFLIPRAFNTVPHVVATPSHTIILLILHNCNFAIAVDYNVNTWLWAIWYGTPKGSQPTGLKLLFYMHSPKTCFNFHINKNNTHLWISDLRIMKKETHTRIKTVSWLFILGLDINWHFLQANKEGDQHGMGLQWAETWTASLQFKQQSPSFHTSLYCLRWPSEPLQ